jgi:hypothetical protein
MKKKYFILVICILVLIFPVLGQSLKLTFNSDTIKSDSVYNYICSISKLNIDSVGVTNTSDKTISVTVKKIIIDTLHGTFNTFCWGVNCFEPTTYISPTSINIAPGTTNKSFYGEYNPMGKVGSSTIRYVFFDKNNYLDSSYVTVKYILKPASVADLSGLQTINIFLNIYPNPFRHETAINYKLPENSFVNIKTYDLTGRELFTLLDDFMVKGEHVYILNSVDLKEGFYYCVMTTNNNLFAFKKIAVIH